MKSPMTPEVIPLYNLTEKYDVIMFVLRCQWKMLFKEYELLEIE